MKLSWRDIAATLFAIGGALVVFAKLESYSWALIGSWKGALGVVAILGLATASLYAVDWFNNTTMGPLGEMFLWGVAALTIVISLLVTTSKAEFVWSAALLGIAWGTELGAHAWDTTHHHTSHMAHAH